MRAALCLTILVFIGLNLHHADADTVALGADAVALVEVTGQQRCWRPDDVSTTPIPNRPIEIACLNSDAAGQDGAVRAGVPFPNPRFTVNGDMNKDGDCSDQGEMCDGTVRDNLTGLIWLQDTDCMDNRTWAEALNLVSNLEDVADNMKDCGLNDKSRKGDWRLPNVKELQSLIDFGYSDPALSNAAGTSQCTDDDCAFQDMGSGRTYWSSTTFIESDPRKPPVNKAWAVDVGNANTLPHFRWKEDWEEAKVPIKFFVWPVKGPVSGIGSARVEATGQMGCWNSLSESNIPEEIACTRSDAAGQDGAVRAGVPFPSPRFTANGDLNGDGDCTDSDEICDGTVTDKLTGLIWLKNANCFSTKTWAEALDLANNLEDGADHTKDCGLNDKSHKGDWRLPNVKELQSLIDFDKHIFPEAALTAGHPFEDVRPRYYWSSTTSASEWDAFSCICRDDPFPGEPDDAWAVSLTEGITVLTGNTRACESVIKNELRGVWLVRGGITGGKYQSYLPLLRK
jgi:hypothetical protein